jgi:hypothetical protein
MVIGSIEGFLIQERLFGKSCDCVEWALSDGGG